MPAVLLLVVGVLLAVGAPTAWALTHRDPALTPIGSGVAVALAESGAGPDTDDSDTFGPSSAATNQPPAPESDTLATVPTTTTSMPTSSSPSSKAGGLTTASPESSASPKSSVSPKTSESPKTSASPNAVPPKTTASPKTPVVPTTSAPPKAVAPKPAAPPVRPPARLRIPAIGVDAPVGPVGLNDRGEMAIPEQVQEIGWYQYGPAPGATSGSAVLSGHVDSAQQGLGAFSRLGDLKAGDVITVTDAAGRQLPYRVVGKEAFDKKSVPLADLFSRSGAARLTLITCGGAFDSSARSYVDNIVVTAVPA